jgi:Tfp pilus assembly protein PilF
VPVQRPHFRYVRAGTWRANDAALKALFDQANYWHEKSHDDLAMESLRKVLMVDANNTQAMYLMALWAQQNGDLQVSSQWRTRLAQVSLTIRGYRHSIMPNS